MTIVDDDEPPQLRLSVDRDQIIGEDSSVAAVTISSQNGKTFPGNQAITVNFSGPADYGDDYTVTPVDADAADGHQATLMAGCHRQP